MASDAAKGVLGHVWSALEPLQVPRALIGGLALAVWSYPRATRDVDLLIGVGPAGIEPIIEHLQAIGCRPKKTPPEVHVGDHLFLQFLYTPPGEFYEVQFDLLLAQSDLEQSALKRAVERTVPDVDAVLRVLCCDDLILFKLVSGRVIDLADAAMLLRENRDQIDAAYMKQWLGRLNLSAAFSGIWREAFPGEPLPEALHES